MEEFLQRHELAALNFRTTFADGREFGFRRSVHRIATCLEILPPGLAQELGVEHYVAKPVDEASFVQLIESLAGTAPARVA